MKDESGFHWFMKAALVVVGVGIAGLIVLAILSKAIIAWGVFGTFIVIAIGLLIFGAIWDKRNPGGFVRDGDDR